jgi:hypothetical protein
MRILKLAIVAFFLLSFPSFAEETSQDCLIIKEVMPHILREVERKNPDAIKTLPDCFKADRQLILKASLIDPLQFQNAAENLKEDENFVRRLLKISPEILQFASPKLLSNQNFMERATYLNRNALQYADPKLLDNKLFMKKMIAIDSKNYGFASERLREIAEFAEVAFFDDGLLLAKAPQKIRSDKKLAEIAIKSNSSAIEFVADELKLDKELQKLAEVKTSIKSKEDLEKFLQKNYVIEERKKNLGWVTANKARFFKKNKIIDRNYVTKWQRNLDINGNKIGENLRLISADSRNYPILWKEDFRKHPDLIRKIEKFFLKHNLDQVTIDSLSLTYLWKIKAKPLTFAFNLYLLRDSKDIDLDVGFSDITSLTAIVQKQNDRWEMSVAEVIFDSETRVDIGYRNGHKKYVLWDLYASDEEDKNPKIIFKIEDRFKEYFEVFEEQNGGKYQAIGRFESLSKKKLSDK